MTTYDHRYEDRRAIAVYRAVAVICCWALLLTVAVAMIRFASM